MTLKKESCRSWKLYVITDSSSPKSRDLREVVREALEGGADVIQLRDKTASDLEMTRLARSLLEITRSRNAVLIINDRLRVAQESGADGLHLGQEDGSLTEARLVLGEQAILGRSTHSREQALSAQEEGADYIGIGPVFRTPTKVSYEPVGLELVSFAAKNISLPFVAIGGIDAQNADLVRNAGARTVAVVRAVMGAQDPRGAARDLKKIMTGKGSA